MKREIEREKEVVKKGKKVEAVRKEGEETVERKRKRDRQKEREKLRERK